MEIQKLFSDKIIFQVRFESGYLYWDRTGRIWKNLAEKWRNLKEIKIDTNNALFSIDNEKITLGYDCNNINTTVDEPDDIDVYSDFTKDAVSIISRELEVETFIRIGNRFQFIYPVETPDDAYSIFFNAGLISIPNEAVKLFGSNLNLLNLGFKISDEDEDIIYKLQFSYIERNLVLNLPKSVTVDQTKFIRRGIMIDVDRYTNKMFDASLLDCKKLIQDNRRHILQKLSQLFSKGV